MPGVTHPTSAGRRLGGAVDGVSMVEVLLACALLAIVAVGLRSISSDLRAAHDEARNEGGGREDRWRLVPTTAQELRPADQATDGGPDVRTASDPPGRHPALRDRGGRRTTADTNRARERETGKREPERSEPGSRQ